MSVTSFLRRLIDHLNSIGVPYMIVGSLAGTYHGRPRTTEDIDLVVAIEPEHVDRLVDLDPERYYVSRDAAEDAVRRAGQFNIIDMETGWKADLIVLKRRPFSLEEFARRKVADILGVRCFVASAEDTILSKLEWAKAGESERQLRDVKGVVETQAGSLDLEYIERWARSLEVSDLWEQVRGG